MVRLSDLLQQSIPQTLGITDVLNQRQREAEQLGQATLGAEQIVQSGELAGAQTQAQAMSNIGQAFQQGVQAEKQQAQQEQKTLIDLASQGIIEPQEVTLSGKKMLIKKPQEFAFDKNVGLYNKSTGEVKLSLNDLGTPTEDKGKKFDQETKLRNEFQNVTKDYRGIRDSYTRVEESASDPSAAGDLALIFNYMKILDPGSVVREGEFANAQNAAGVPDRVKNMYNRAINGERLGEVQRKDFVNSARKLYRKREDQYNQTSQ